MIKVLVVDDSKMIAHSLKTIIEQDNEIKVVALGFNGMEAFNECVIHMPDVVLMDIKMPIYDGIKGVKLIKDKFGDKIRILMLTTFGNSSFLDEAIKSGADGYVLKDLNNEELISAIKAVSCGLMVIKQGLVKKQQSKNIKYIDTNIVDYKTNELTWIEYNILKNIIEGKSSKEIAYILGISDGSVRNKTSSLLSKFGVSDRTSLAIYALENGYA
jgi:DNA-binding NarL/FixJ family response regulator